VSEDWLTGPTERGSTVTGSSEIEAMVNEVDARLEAREGRCLAGIPWKEVDGEDCRGCQRADCPDRVKGLYRKALERSRPFPPRGVDPLMAQGHA
jgi:hypothetical protein